MPPRKSKTRRATASKSRAKKRSAPARQSPIPPGPPAFDAVRRIAHTLDGVEDGTSYGTAALKVRGDLFIRLREDGDTLVLCCPIEQRDALIAEDSDTFFLTDHYVNYPWVLARISSIHPANLRDIVIMAYRNATNAKGQKTKKKI
jgi:hypothetical protein